MREQINCHAWIAKQSIKDEHALNNNRGVGILEECHVTVREQLTHLFEVLDIVDATWKLPAHTCQMSHI